jgi:hypothetical protein
MHSIGGTRSQGIKKSGCAPCKSFAHAFWSLDDDNLFQSTFDSVAPLSGTLQSINVVVVPSVPLHHLQKVEAFLLQAMAPLRRINMWFPATVSTYGSRCISWEVRFPFDLVNIRSSFLLQRRWLYDNDLRVPRRYIAVIPRPDEQWRNKD